MVEEKKEPVSEITKEEESVLEIKEEKKEDKKEEKPIVKEEIPVEKTAAPVKLAEEKTQASEPEIKTQAPVIAEPVLKEEPVESFTEQPIYGMPKSFEPPQAIEPVQTETVLAEEQPEFNLKTRPKRKPEKTPMPAPRKRQLITSTYADEILKSYQEVGNRLTFKIPTELKVVFYRNATDISGQTMKWIKVFATQALRDSRLKVDIRVSTQSPEIQQARIALIEQILQDQGLTAHQIQISYSDRDPDSLVLSTRSTELLAQNIETKRRFGKKETKKIREW